MYVSASHDTALPPVNVRWPESSIIIGRIAAVSDYIYVLLPGPQFHHAVNPKVQMKGARICIEVTNLLLAHTLDLFAIMKILSIANSSKSIRYRFYNLFGGGRKFGAQKSSPTVTRIGTLCGKVARDAQEPF